MDRLFRPRSRPACRRAGRVRRRPRAARVPSRRVAPHTAAAAARARATLLTPAARAPAAFAEAQSPDGKEYYYHENGETSWSVPMS